MQRLSQTTNDNTRLSRLIRGDVVRRFHQRLTFHFHQARSTTPLDHGELQSPSDKPKANVDRAPKCFFTPPSGPHGVADEGSPRWKRPSSAGDHDRCVSYVFTASLLATTFHFILLFPPNTLLQQHGVAGSTPLVPTIAIHTSSIDVQRGLLLGSVLVRLHVMFCPPNLDRRM